MPHYLDTVAASPWVLAVVIVFARYLPGGRSTTALAAGVVGCPAVRFHWYTAIGVVVWAVEAALIGYRAAAGGRLPGVLRAHADPGRPAPGSRRPADLPALRLRPAAADERSGHPAVPHRPARRLPRRLRPGRGRHRQHGSRRGYPRCVVNRAAWHTDVRTVETIDVREAPVTTSASYAVEAGASTIVSA